MPADWSRPQDVERLADAGACEEFAVSPRQFPRLRPQLSADAGRVAGQVRVSRVSGRPVVRVALQAEIPLVCQRCLGRVDVQVEAESLLVVLRDLDEGRGLAPDVEPVVAVDGRVALRDLVEEELLLGLPLVPRHEDPAGCTAEQDRGPAPGTDAGDAAHRRERGAAARQEAAQGTQTPFAGLSELLKRRD
jgi:uncharacterized protein